MNTSPFRDPRLAARRLGVSIEAIELVRGCELIDLHVDPEIPRRLFGYDVARRHGRWPFFGRYFGHFDLPRAFDGGLCGAMWSITTNPARTRAGRWRALLANLERVSRFLDESDGRVALVRSYDEYRRASSRARPTTRASCSTCSTGDSRPNGSRKCSGATSSVACAPSDPSDRGEDLGGHTESGQSHPPEPPGPQISTGVQRSQAEPCMVLARIHPPGPFELGRRRKMAILLSTLALVFALDRWSKACAFRHVLVGEQRRIAPLLTIRPVRNARPSLWSKGRLESWCVSFGLGLVCALLLVALYPRSGALLAIGLGAALGGALGNLYDRIRHGAVLDFLHVGLGGVFNPADVALTLGLALALGAHLQAAVSMLAKG